MTSYTHVPIETRHLFKPLDEKLIELLKSLEADDWNKQTVAGAWTVKDVASHLLDGNLRTLSMQRDRYFGEPPPEIKGYREMVNWLNQLNADWVKACSRLSPQVLTLLLESTGQLVSAYYVSLPPFEQAIFAVDWAGESASCNWMHVAREYTEKWHHQQQIREATGREGTMTEEFFHPVMDTFFQALPHHFREIKADEGTLIQVTISSLSGGDWYLIRTTDNWALSTDETQPPTVTVKIPGEVSWKLFSKSLRPNDIIDQVTIQGDRPLGLKVLEMVTVMA